MSGPQETTPRADGSGAMFDGIAERYDLVNRLISLGIDRRWRRETARALNLEGEARVLDLATGTGDLAIAIAEHAPGARVLGVDPAARMLEVARSKVERRGLSERIQFLAGDAQELTQPSSSFDAVSIAFGIRNVPDRPRALREMARVTRPGGRIAILELSEPTGFLGPFARFHVHTVVPALGALLSGAPEYRYLQRSIAAFPSPETFTSMLQAAGIEPIAARPLTFGVCHLFVGTPRLSS